MRPHPSLVIGVRMNAEEEFDGGRTMNDSGYFFARFISACLNFLAAALIALSDFLLHFFMAGLVETKLVYLSHHWLTGDFFDNFV